MAVISKIKLLSLTLMLQFSVTPINDIKDR